MGDRGGRVYVERVEAQAQPRPQAERRTTAGDSERFVLPLRVEYPTLAPKAALAPDERLDKGRFPPPDLAEDHDVRAGELPLRITLPGVETKQTPRRLPPDVAAVDAQIIRDDERVQGAQLDRGGPMRRWEPSLTNGHRIS